MEIIEQKKRLKKILKIGADIAKECMEPPIGSTIYIDEDLLEQRISDTAEELLLVNEIVKV